MNIADIVTAPRVCCICLEPIAEWPVGANNADPVTAATADPQDAPAPLTISGAALRRGDRIHPTAGSAVYTVDDVKPVGRRVVVTAHSEPEPGVTMRIEIDYLPTTLVQLDLVTKSAA